MARSELPAAATARAVVRVAGVAWGVLTVALLAVLAVVGLAGWQLQSVLSSSMEPAIPSGSAALIAPTEVGDVETGDVVTFAAAHLDRQIVLHRVVRIIERDAGRRFLQTRGDANAGPDPRFVPADQVQGRMWLHVPFFGRMLAGLTTPAGQGVLIAVPVALWLLDRFGSRHAQRRQPPELLAVDP